MARVTGHGSAVLASGESLRDGLGHLGQVLVVPRQAAPAAEPAKRTFDDRLYNLAR